MIVASNADAASGLPNLPARNLASSTSFSTGWMRATRNGVAVVDSGTGAAGAMLAPVKKAAVKSQQWDMMHLKLAGKRALRHPRTSIDKIEWLGCERRK